MSAQQIAEQFVAARREGRALTEYPGLFPVRMAEAYAIQEAALGLWKQELIGWKIARLHPDFHAAQGTERLAGPIFRPGFKDYKAPVNFPVFDGGYGAVEAEYVLRIDHDADPAKLDYSEEEALRLCDALFVGIETAGSPFPQINGLGPAVTASDFGNNFGLVLGPKIAGIDSDTTLETFSAEALKAYHSRTEIDGKVVGEGGLFIMPGGPFKALAWLAGHLARGGRPLKRGQLISTGQTTGVHRIFAGQRSTITFTGPGDAPIVIELRAVALAPGAPEIAQL